MKKTGVVTDSHSGISQQEAKELGIMVLPMPFTIDGTCYYEDKDLSREDFFRALASGCEVSTSQPSPEEVMNLWDEALDVWDEIVYIPISSGLSGSCGTAKMLSSEEKYEGKVFVVDNGRVATPMHRSVLDALELIQEGYEAAKIREILEKSRDQHVIFITVDNLEYLKKGGRISRSTAALGTILKIKPILKFDVGTLDAYKKCRGFKKARREMLEAIKTEMETTFDGYKKEDIYLVAASSADEATTKEWVEEIQEFFPDKEVMCDPLSLGVSCHIGENGLGIGCSCKPKRD